MLETTVTFGQNSRYRKQVDVHAQQLEYVLEHRGDLGIAMHHRPGPVEPGINGSFFRCIRKDVLLF